MFNKMSDKNINTLPSREKCPYSEFFWPVFSGIRAEYGLIQSISPYLVRMWENTDQKTPNTYTFDAVYLLCIPRS